jgi:pyruvate,water dikinase
MESVYPIDRLPAGQGGGKAEGLSFLQRNGRRIPRTWVVTDPDRTLLEHFAATLPPDNSWAVRSSAEGEDGTDASFAGQYESYLNVKGKDNILKAVLQCISAADSERIHSYRHEKGLQGTGMNVIIQEMIMPRAAGVLFTVDPVYNRHDKMSLSVVSGTAEQLMSGTQEGESLVFYKHRWEKASCKLLPNEDFSRLIREALEIEEAYGRPVDLEWAFDDKGTLYWLQLRPIIGLRPVHMNELDDTPRYPQPIYTRANIGEMMPGPVTPLTRSTFGVAIDRGLQVFYKKCGVFKKVREENIFIHSYYNHLFFDVMALYELPKNVWLSNKENIDYSVMGELVPGITLKKETAFPRSFFNFLHFAHYLSGGKRAAKKLKKLEAAFHLECPDDHLQCYRLISRNMPVLLTAYDLHYVSSSQSGGYFTTILNIFSGGKPPQPEHQEKVARLFTNIPGIESAQGLAALDQMAKMLGVRPEIRSAFLDPPPEVSRRYLESTAPENIREAWHQFMERHGHRCVREAELREKEWRLDPSPVIEGLKAKTTLLLNSKTVTSDNKPSHPDLQHLIELSSFKRSLIKYFLPKARAAVARREQTKALAISVQHQFKLAYRHLARLLVRKGLLKETDQVFFLSHEELGALVRGEEPEKWLEVAEERRKLYPEMMQLSFPDLSFGIPVPEEHSAAGKEGDLTGIPVSRGVTEGKVRLVRSLEEARKLRQGEIMVSRYTDIGWTPFYSIISGLITEIGSPLSHGAVIAREYNLPAVVSVKGALNTLKNGQQIRLDAIRGKVEILN